MTGGNAFANVIAEAYCRVDVLQGALSRLPILGLAHHVGI